MKAKFLVFLILGACASAQKDQSPAVSTDTITESKAEVQIDWTGLQRSLGLDRSKFDLGYQEKTFNTCDAGFGYSKRNCRFQTFVVLNFRLQCRDTVGTTSQIVTSEQSEPIANKQVLWKMAQINSSSTTDEEGYGQIRGVFTRSPRASRVRLSVGPQFVYVRAGELTRVVAPADWCR